MEKRKATHSSILAWRIPRTVWSMGGHKESDTTDQLSLSLCFILGGGRDVTFLKVRAGNPLYILKAMRINTNRSKIVLPCSHDCIFSGANKFEHGNLRNNFTSSISSVFQVNFREMFYFFDFCLGQTGSKSKPVKIREHQVCGSFLELLCGNGIAESQSSRTFLFLLIFCLDKIFLKILLEYS